MGESSATVALNILEGSYGVSLQKPELIPEAVGLVQDWMSRKGF